MLDLVYTCFVHVKFLRSMTWNFLSASIPSRKKDSFIAFQPTCLFGTLEYVVRLKQIADNVQNTVDKKFTQIWFHLKIKDLIWVNFLLITLIFLIAEEVGINEEGVQKFKNQ